jgi:branched-chain amino acid transport system substrate-binding protein
MKKTIIAVLFLCVVSGITLDSPPVLSANLAGKEVILGWLGPFTGMGAAYGEKDSVTMKIALDEINSRGGVGGLPLKVVKYDTSWKGEHAIAMLKKLAQTDKVVAVMGPFSSVECVVTFPVANMLKIPIITSTGVSAPGTDLLGKNRPWAFRNCPTLENTLAAVFDKWVEMYKVKTIAKIYESTNVIFLTEATKILPSLFYEHRITGINIRGMITTETRQKIQEVSTQTFIKGDNNFLAQTSAMKAANPEGIWLSAASEEGANIVREIRRQGMTQPIITGTGITGPSFIRLGGKDTEGVVQPSNFWADNPDPKVQEFVKKWSAAYKGEIPSQYTANLYETIYILKHVVETSGVTNNPADLEKDRESIMWGLGALKDFPGLGLKITIGPDGDARKPPYVLQVKDGKWVRVE